MVYAENEKGKIIPSTQKSVSFNGHAPVNISLDVHPENFQNKYGKCCETLNWRCESKDGKQSQFLGETTYRFYFLENVINMDFWSLANLPDNPNVGWVRPVGGGRYEPQGRTEDDPFIWEHSNRQILYRRLWMPYILRQRLLMT